MHNVPVCYTKSPRSPLSMSVEPGNALIPYEYIQVIQVNSVSASSRVSRARLNHDIIVICKVSRLSASEELIDSGFGRIRHSIRDSAAVT